jgi:hypothetical protein
MGIVERGVMVGMVAALLAVQPAGADNNPNGLAFRALGFYKGRAEISVDQITCEIPTVSSAISDGAFAMGMWNTFGFATNYFPDPNHPFGNPCGGWIQLQNNMLDQGVSLTHVDLRYRIQGARRFQPFVPAFRKFPVGCRTFRREKIFIGGYVSPMNSTLDSTGSGRPNVVFAQMLPMVNTQLVHCLRDQYASLSTDMFTSLSLVTRARVFGVSDAGDNFVTNTILYTLNLRHTCGNGRIDDGEACDPRSVLDGCAIGVCENNECTTSGRPCTVNSDCNGVCIPSNDPMECHCGF